MWQLIISDYGLDESPTITCGSLLFPIKFCNNVDTKVRQSNNFIIEHTSITEISLNSVSSTMLHQYSGHH